MTLPGSYSSVKATFNYLSRVKDFPGVVLILLGGLKTQERFDEVKVGMVLRWESREILLWIVEFTLLEALGLFLTGLEDDFSFLKEICSRWIYLSFRTGRKEWIGGLARELLRWLALGE